MFRPLTRTSARMTHTPALTRAYTHKIVCVDADLAGQLFKSLGKLGIECTQLSEPEGLDDYVRFISDQLVHQQVAARGDVAEREGLLTDPALTRVGLVGLFKQAAAAVGGTSEFPVDACTPRRRTAHGAAHPAHEAAYPTNTAPDVIVDG